MLLSIIIPVYNLEAEIGRCLESCLRQQLNKNEYEIICVNDGSSDNSSKILREYEQRFPQIIVLDQKNSGVSSARNAGLQIARGTYLWFIDGDDWIADNSCSIIKRGLDQQAVFPKLISFGARKTTQYENHCITEEISWALQNKAVKNKMKYALPGLWNHWFLRSIVEEYHIRFDETLKYSEDILFLANFKLYCETELVADLPLYNYFQRPGSAMHNYSAVKYIQNMLNLAKGYKRLYETAPSKDAAKKMKVASIRAMQAVCSSICILCNDKAFTKTFLSNLKQQQLYPYGVDWKQFCRDRSQSLKSDILNWIFGFLSCEVYFWICWHLCGILFQSKRVEPFTLSDFFLEK